jgi:hypothetical protein
MPFRNILILSPENNFSKLTPEDSPLMGDYISCSSGDFLSSSRKGSVQLLLPEFLRKRVMVSR